MQFDMSAISYTATFYLILQLALAAGRINYEKKLREHLFLHRQEFETTRRPVEYQNETITLKIGLQLNHITAVNTKQGYVSVCGWLRMIWHDNSFKWNKDDFGGITDLRIPSNLVWKPDLTLYNHFSADSAANFGQTLAILYSNGNVLWVPPIVIKFTCDFHNLQSFPYDEHKCIIKFGSWTYDGYNVDLRFFGNDSSTLVTEQTSKSKKIIEHSMQDVTKSVLKDYQTNNHEWDLVSVFALRNEKIYSCCVEPYPDITYYIELKRVSPYYTVTLLLPSIFVMIFILAGFWLPPMAEEKLTISAFNMIYLIILLLHVHFMLEGSYYNIPGIVLFLCLSLIFAVLSLVLGMCTYNLTQSQQDSFPSNILMRLINGKLGWILCLPQVKESLESNLLTSHEAHDNMEIPEGDSERSPIDEWITLATAIDRIFFISYCFIFIIILSYCFS